jgi:hypothetical protein
MGQLTTVISERLNPTGLNEIVVRPFGPSGRNRRAEVDPQEVDKIKNMSDRRRAAVHDRRLRRKNTPARAGPAASRTARSGSAARDVQDADGRQVGLGQVWP